MTSDADVIKALIVQVAQTVLSGTQGCCKYNTCVCNKEASIIFSFKSQWSVNGLLNNQQRKTYNTIPITFHLRGNPPQLQPINNTLCSLSAWECGAEWPMGPGTVWQRGPGRVTLPFPIQPIVQMKQTSSITFLSTPWLFAIWLTNIYAYTYTERSMQELITSASQRSFLHHYINRLCMYIGANVPMYEILN